MVLLSARSTGEDTNPAPNSRHPGFVLLIQNKAVDCDRARRSRLRHIARHYVRKTRRRASARTGGLPTSRDRFRACWNSAVNYKPGAAKFFIVLLLCWQVVSSVRARHDYVAYFNELVGKDPSQVLITGCDLDCGQDMLRLSNELAKKHISKISIAAWTTADLSRLGLPAFHSSYGPEAFAWLSSYRPVEQIGSTIRLYYIPSDATNQTR